MREVPVFNIQQFFQKRSKYCICIPVINEGEKIRKQLKEMSILMKKYDTIILDGGSTDGSIDEGFFKKVGVRSLLVKKDTGKLSAQLRMGYNYALEQGYEGVVTIDGNGKDSVNDIPNFIKHLDIGYDFVQGSRYVEGGEAINTPRIRELAIKLIHRPIISMLSGYKYTDTTNGYRGYSRKLLVDNRLCIFREIFDTYELLAYISVKAPRLGFKVIEIPVKREYPLIGKTPTKISFFKGNFKLLQILLFLFVGRYDPEKICN